MTYATPAPQETVTKTMEALTANGYEAFSVQTEAEAMEKIKQIIPSGASVMNGSSKTLEQIGFIEHLKSGSHGWNNLHASVLSEKDPAKQSLLRKHATVSDFYLGSVHALVENGEFIIASNTASQLPSVTYNSQNLLFVIGTQKIVPTVAEGMKRLEEYVVPLEDQNMRQKYGMGTQLSKILIFRKENSMGRRKIRMILVNKTLGF